MCVQHLSGISAASRAKFALNMVNMYCLKATSDQANDRFLLHWKGLYKV